MSISSTFFEKNEVDSVQEPDVEPGGSTEMNIWDADDQTQVDSLLQDAVITNASSYSIPPGIAVPSFFNKTEKTTTYSGLVERGSSVVMDIWDADDQTQVDSLLQAGVTNNASSYTIPGGISVLSFFNKRELQIEVPSPGTEVGYTFLGTKAKGVVLVSPDPEADDPDTYRLEGITVHTTDGTNDYVATVDPRTGEYELPLGEGGTYTVEARHPALDTVTTEISPADGESVPDTDLLMKLGGSGGGGGGGLSIGGGKIFG